MPIIIDSPADVADETFDSANADLDTLVAASTAKKPKLAKTLPTFFHSALNGSGKATGALHAGLAPHKLDPLMDEQKISEITKKHTTRNGEIKVRYIPTGIITEGMVAACERHEVVVDLPDAGERLELGRMTNSSGVEYVFSAKIRPQSIVLVEEGTRVANRELTIRYRLDVFACAFDDGDEATSVEDITPQMTHATAGNYVTTMFTTNPIRTMYAYTKAHLPIVLVDADVDAGMAKYNVADELIAQVNEWKGDSAATFIDRVVPQLATVLNAVDPTLKVSSLTVLRDQIRYFESYGMNLDTYHRIYASLEQHLDTPLVAKLSKSNTNLQFANMTEELRRVKPQMTLLPDVTITVDPFFSKQQKEVICTREPFVIVQSGAGTGKSTTINGRLDALNQFGVPDTDIMVTSFTNTAADNIKAKRPNIRSMTLAAMINEIYTTNFPQHELSSIDTLGNCLRIKLPTSTVARDLETRLAVAEREKTLSSFTELSAFVETNFDEVIKCLDVVGQTTLELESIICYQQIDKIVEPTSVRTNYMLIDEVQDNSVFEFIYVLKRAAKYKQQLYLVGDPSQTMYEFRNANPKALNAMESSGVFATYKLTTNYRSNQDVLDFANKFLMDIEANQFAKIQLHSYQFTQQTLDTLKERVNVKYIRVNTLKEFTDGFEAIVARAASQFVDDALARGEKVAFLSRTRMHAHKIEKMLAASYPGVEVASMVPDVVKDSVAFTTYIRKYWDTVTSVAPADAAFVIHTQLKNLSNEILPRNATDGLQKAHLRNVDAWYTQNHQNIATWLQGVRGGIITRADFFANMQRSLVEFEINNNRVRSSVVSQKNSANKEKNANSSAPLVVSTVHSVKGLEFDNVVVLYEDKDTMPEDLKRLYYVALTRAKNRLLVVGYGRTTDPAIQVNYGLLMKEIEDRVNAAALTQDDDVEVVEDDVIIARAQAAEEEEAQYDASHDAAALDIAGFSFDDTVEVTDPEAGQA